MSSISSTEEKSKKRQLDEQAMHNDSIESMKSEFLALPDPTMKDLGLFLVQVIDKSEEIRSMVYDVQHRTRIVEDKYKQLTQRVKAIEVKSAADTTEIRDMKVVSASNEASLHKLEQGKLDNDVFLSGFPVKPDHKKVKMALNRLYKIAPEMVDYSYQYEYVVKSKLQTRSAPNEVAKQYHHVVISYKEKSIKNDIMKRKKEMGPLKYEQLDPTVNSPADKAAVIRCSNRLSKFNLKAQGHLFKAKNEGKISGFQLHNGVFRVKEGENSDWKIIDTEASLEPFSNAHK